MVLNMFIVIIHSINIIKVSLQKYYIKKALFIKQHQFFSLNKMVKLKNLIKNEINFFEYIPRYPKNINELRKLINIFLDYYNNVRRHKSINFLTPSEAVLKFLKD